MGGVKDLSSPSCNLRASYHVRSSALWSSSPRHAHSFSLGELEGLQGFCGRRVFAGLLPFRPLRLILPAAVSRLSPENCWPPKRLIGRKANLLKHILCSPRIARDPALQAGVAGLANRSRPPSPATALPKSFASVQNAALQHNDPVSHCSGGPENLSIDEILRRLRN